MLEPFSGFDLVDGECAIVVDDYSPHMEFAAPLADLVCAICQHPFTQPVTTLCGHTFCKQCLELALDQLSPKCPMDRTLLDPDTDVFPAPLLVRNLVAQLTLKCLNVGRGCTWEGRRSGLAHHLRHCGFTRVPCDGIRWGEEEEEPEVCREWTEQRWLELRVEGDIAPVCRHYTYTCAYCKQQLLELYREHHVTECPEYYQKCPHCDDFLPLRDHELHAQDGCSHKHAVCEAQEYGCDWTLGKNNAGESVETHHAGCVFRKLQQSAAVRGQQEALVRMQRENETLSLLLETIVQAVVSGRLSKGFSELEEVVTSDNRVVAHELQHRASRANRQRDLSLAREFDHHMLYEVERLRVELDQLMQVPGQLNEALMMVNLLHQENVMITQELAVQRGLTNNLRRQLLMIAARTRGFGASGPQPMVPGFSSSDDEAGDSTCRKNTKL